MLIELNKIDGVYHFEAKNESGNKVDIDASPAIGGTGKGARPMELLIMGLGGCSAIDIISILQKQKIDVKDFKIKIDAQRQADAIPALFEKIHIEFILKGDIDQAKAERAASLSMEKYCSVAKTLEKTATITHSLTIEREYTK